MQQGAGRRLRTSPEGTASTVTVSSVPLREVTTARRRPLSLTAQNRTSRQGCGGQADRAGVGVDADDLVGGEEDQGAGGEPGHVKDHGAPVEGGVGQDVILGAGADVEDADLAGGGVGDGELGAVGGEGGLVRDGQRVLVGDPFVVGVALVAQEGRVGVQGGGQGAGAGDVGLAAGGLGGQEHGEVAVGGGQALGVGQDPGLGGLGGGAVGGVGGLVGSAGLLEGEGAGEEGEDEEGAGGGEGADEAPVLAGLVGGAGVGLGVFAVGEFVAGGQEVGFGAVRATVAATWSAASSRVPR